MAAILAQGGAPIASDGLSLESHDTRGERIKPRQHARNRALAAAALAHQRQRASWVERECGILDGMNDVARRAHPELPERKVLAQMNALQHGWRLRRTAGEIRCQRERGKLLVSAGGVRCVVHTGILRTHRTSSATARLVPSLDCAYTSS